MGIKEVDPDEYRKRFGSHLIERGQIEKIVGKMPTPGKRRTSDSSKQQQQQQQSSGDEQATKFTLEGDVEALALIDLDENGLGQFKNELKRRGLVK